ncbi:ATP-binding protein [Lysobacter sp. CA199]|uniref:ATP-binding protein n=1 Tax=Lysobacter sp. CA199 TaxID=3455608 RepID=UPI003F8D00B2
MQQAKGSTFWKRYFVLILAVSLFLVIAASLIGASLLLSQQIAQGTHARDIAGAERSASQIVLRSMLEMQQDLAAGRPVDQETRDTLKQRSQLIGNTITVFRDGGMLPGDEDGSLDRGIISAEMADLNGRIAKIWTPYQAHVKPLLAGNTVDAAELARAIDYGRGNNTELFGLLNKQVAASQAITEKANQRLSTAQTIGAALIVLNFLFTALVAFRRLLAGDRAVIQSRKQTDDILATVKEGLFLVTGDFMIGNQMSTSLSQIMQRKVEPGMNLIEVMRPMVAPQTLEATRDYLGLLFGKRVKENLVASLNPLSEVPVAGGSDGRGQPQPRYLNFQFNRVQESEGTVYLLVTVSDATERVRLTNEIAAAKTRTREEMEGLLRVLSRESSEVRFFLHRIGVVLERVNDDLRQAAARRSGTDYSELVNAIFRDVHSLKSEAAALGLEMIEALAHNFEVDLIGLRDRGSVEGSDMVKMTVHLDDMFECVTTIREFLDRINGSRDSAEPRVSAASPSQRAVEGWRGLAERIAREQGKQVQLDMQLEAFDRVPAEPLNALRTIGLQLLRNAVAHGIEPVEERRAVAKSPVGTISFRSEDIGSRQIELVARDDGRGIDAKRVRAALANSAQYTPEQLSALSDRDAIMKIFEPGVSTATDGGDRDSGHGVGMDLVMKQVRAMSGTISLATKVGAYTEFRIRLPVAEIRPAAAPVAPNAPVDSGEFQLSF